MSKPITPAIEKPTISVGQALLILIDKYKNDKERLLELKKLYLTGAKDDDALHRIDEYLKDEILKKYNVSKEPKVIDNDPTRRYFETHLSYETLLRSLKDIDAEKLKTHTQSLLELLPKTKQDDIKDILNGKAKEELLPPRYRGISDVISRIDQDRQFKDMSPIEKEKLKNLYRSSFLAFLITFEYGSVVPLRIYGTGIYSEESRGRVEKSGDTSQVTSQSMGLIKGHMPLSSIDAAFSDVPFSYPKPSDHSTYKVDAEWVKENFKRLVHPFSNSISGTMLCQLRVILYLQQQGKLKMDNIEEMTSFLKTLTATLLFKSGGHTLHEFTGMLQLPEVQTAFKFMPGFSNLTLETMFYDPKKNAFNAEFDAALNSVLDYNKKILQRQELLQSLPKAPITFLSLVGSSEYYLGNINNINFDYIDNNSSFLAKSGTSYVFVCKDSGGKIQQFLIEITRDGFSFQNESAKQHFKLEKEEDFNLALSELAKTTDTTLYTAATLNAKINATKIKELVDLLKKCESIDKAEKLLSDPKMKSIIKLKTEDGYNAFTDLVGEKKFEIAELLLKNGASPDVIFAGNTTFLMTAAMQGDQETVEFLLKHGANAKLRSSNGDTALTLAIRLKNNSIASFLLDLTKTDELEKKDKLGCTPFLSAVSSGNTEMALKLISKNVRINIHDKKGYSGLMHAVKLNNREIINYFLKRPDIRDIVNLVGGSGETALLIAAKNGNLELVKLLINSGADPTIGDFQGNSALKYALNSNNFEMIKFLLDYPVNLKTRDKDGNSVLMSLIWFHQNDLANRILKNSDVISLLNEKDSAGKTALQLAIESGNNEMADRLLLEKSVVDGVNSSIIDAFNFRLDSLNIKDSKQKNDIKEIERVLQELLSKRVDLSSEINTVLQKIKHIYFSDALKTAFANKEIDKIKGFILDPAYSENINKKTIYGDSFLTLAASHGYTDIAMDLIKKEGTNIDIKNERGRTAFMIAADRGNLELVNALLAAKCKILEKDPWGGSALTYASTRDHLKVTERILQEIEKKELVTAINEKTPGGRTLLTSAAYFGSNDMVLLLLKNGADPNLLEKSGMSPLAIAIQNGHVEVADKLIKAGANLSADFIKNEQIIKTHPAFKNIAPEDVDPLIESGISYFIRPIKLPGCFICTIREKERIVHIPIKATETGFDLCYLDKNKQLVVKSSHATFSDLLEHAGAIAPIPKAKEEAAPITFMAKAKGKAKEELGVEKPQVKPPDR